MSERLTKALEFINYRLTLNNATILLKIQTKLIQYKWRNIYYALRINYVCRITRYKEDVVQLTISNPLLLKTYPVEDNVSIQVTNDYFTSLLS